MSKPIKINEEFVKLALREFYESITKSRMTDGKITYTKSFDSNKDKAVVYLTPAAYAKTAALLREFSKEVAWNGSAKRLDTITTDDGTIHQYLITDVFVYPQKVTGATVTMDLEGYGKWLAEKFMDHANDEDPFEIRMQGHSHVNMGVTPSSVDLNHYEQTLSEIGDDGFYIFMIGNKSMSFNTMVYDMDANLYFDNKDSSVEIYGDFDMGDFISESKSLVTEATYSTYYSTPAKPAKPATKADKGKKAKKTEVVGKAMIETEDCDYDLAASLRDAYDAEEDYDLSREWYRNHGYDLYD